MVVAAGPGERAKQPTAAPPKGKKKAATISSSSSSPTVPPPTSAREAAQSWAPLLERAARGLCLLHERLWTDIATMEQLARGLGARMAK